MSLNEPVLPNPELRTSGKSLVLVKSGRSLNKTLAPKSAERCSMPTHTQQLELTLALAQLALHLPVMKADIKVTDNCLNVVLKLIDELITDSVYLEDMICLYTYEILSYFTINYFCSVT